MQVVSVYGYGISNLPRINFVRPDLGPNCLHRLSVDDTSRQRVNSYLGTIQWGLHHTQNDQNNGFAHSECYNVNWLTMYRQLALI